MWITHHGSTPIVLDSGSPGAVTVSQPERIATTQERAQILEGVRPDYFAGETLGGRKRLREAMSE